MSRRPRRRGGGLAERVRGRGASDRFGILRTTLARQRGSLLCATEGAGAAPAVTPAIVAPAAALLIRQVLRDGELVLLVLKPSRWFILLNSLWFAAIVLLAVCGMQLAHAPHMRFYAEAASFAIAGRLMWSILSWMGRLYVLTDQRIVRMSGVFNVDLFDCPLRKVAGTRLVPTFRERLLRLGSIEITPMMDDRPCSVWQTIRKPAQVNEQILAAIHRAKQGGCNGML